METIGDRIRAQREAQGMDRGALAKRARLAKSTLSDLENNHSHSSTKLHLIAEALGVRAEWLETGRGPMRPLNKSGTETENNSRPRQESQSVTLDEDTLHEAITLLLHDEMQAGVYPPRAKTRRLVELYEWIAAEGGRLSNASNREYERQVLARQQGVAGAGTNQKGVDRR